jgi:hypothetical protein
MQLKTEKPVYRGLASGSYPFEDLMPFDAAIVTNLYFGRIHHRESRAFSKTTVQIDAQGNQPGGYPLHKTVIANEFWKSCKPVYADFFEIKRFEVSVMRLVKGDLDRHDFAQGQSGTSLAVFVTIAKEVFVPQGFKNLAEIIHRAEKFF